MPPKERDYDNTVITLRLASAEAVRFWAIMDAAKARNPYVGKSDVYRELLGLAPPQALSDSEIRFFRTGEKRGAFHAAPLVEPKHPIRHVNKKEVEHKKKKTG